jgi:hypothetical protein
LAGGGGDDLAQVRCGAGGLGQVGGQLWPVGIGSQARVDGVDEVVPAGGVGAAPSDAGGGMPLQ